MLKKGMGCVFNISSILFLIYILAKVYYFTRAFYFATNQTPCHLPTKQHMTYFRNIRTNTHKLFIIILNRIPFLDFFFNKVIFYYVRKCLKNILYTT